MSGVYISFPFCSQKCTYCNFASGVLPKTLEGQYVEALRAEIVRHNWRWTPDTVYLGGGTPSQMDPGTLDSILSLIPWRPWKEATIEAAPGSIDAVKAAAWARSGLNRVSLGVQSFAPRELARTGRRHTAETVAADVQWLREAGFEHINIDLIAGLPCQTRDSWNESLDWVEKLAPDHVSVYMLEVDEDSRLGRELLAGGGRYSAAEVPSDDLIVEFYEEACERLERLGIHRYEISNFARRGAESLHNLKYWKLEPYIGFGADAHSFDGNMRGQNVETALQYVEAMRDRESAVAETVLADLFSERFFVGLRMSEGIRPAEDEWKRFEEPIQRFLAEGLLEKNGDLLRLTRQGVLLSNEVFAEFVA
ncbi:coproporphyrinogen III oxidase [Bryobacterales bacterium F-183]|nr:coproporphyrinogen III oxidase [Bryobacterales bacterium F-183]